MRATFSVDLPTGSNREYPKDDELITFLASYGWELKDTLGEIQPEESIEEKIKQYQSSAANLIDKMPETEADEINCVIFFGSRNKIPFFVSQQTPSQMTFRLICDDLAKLQSTTENIIKLLSERRILGKRLKISNNEISIYEPYCPQGATSTKSVKKAVIKIKPMIFGRIIPSVFGETIKRGRKDFVVALFSVVILIALYETEVLGLLSLATLKAVFDELYIVTFTTLAVSLFGLGQSYLETFLEVKYNHRIVWENSEGTKII